ncbi:MAG: hypothetical protein QGH42_00865 [Kiritimatiellia bacterium]|nr:hypothetical protein [Pseudomonadales bacterium]MDP6472594.1 hypothetical protein [Pseudomonadales bacterium]MDP6829265.1 hypothetical protein [Pseudomonadales bacterium]MDP7022789.1 hypothetical protein [Kiritimatiellia bacterium]
MAENVVDYRDRWSWECVTFGTHCLNCLATCFEGVFEAVCVPSPWLPEANSAIARVMAGRNGEHGTPSRTHNWAESSGGPYRNETMNRILEHPKVHIPDWVVDAAKDTIDYFVGEYGIAPAYISPVRAKFSLQAHHVDTDYYEQFHEGAFALTDPDAVGAGGVGGGHGQGAVADEGLCGPQRHRLSRRRPFSHRCHRIVRRQRNDLHIAGLKKIVSGGHFA